MYDVMLTDLVNLHDLNEMVAQRYVDVQTHPTLPLTILNYSKNCMYDRKWNDVTLQCRGLIYETHTGRVIARGPKKFWNYGQPEAKTYPMDTLVNVTKKEDGSLGIVWEYEGHYGVATRGSFMSGQALHATEMLQKDEYTWLRECAYWHKLETVVVEVVYPTNRIVLDYKGKDELMPLGSVDNASGVIYTRDLKWTNPSAPEAELYLITLGEAIAMSVPDDEEGYVLDIYGSEFGSTYGGVVDHLKLKGEIYKMLHAVLTNTSARRIWTQLAARACHQWINKSKDWAKLLGQDPADFERVEVDKPLAESLGDMPDEFLEWVDQKITEIEANVEEHLANMRYDIAWLKDFDGRERHENGKHIREYNELNWTIRSNDERHIIMRAWKEAYPDGHDLPFMSDDE